MGPIGKIIINTIYECNDADTPEGDDFKYIVDLVNNDGDKALNVDFENKIPFDRSLNVRRKTCLGFLLQFFKNFSLSPILKNLKMEIGKLFTMLKEMFANHSNST